MAEGYEFADFRLDVRERTLARRVGGERVALPDKAFDTLCVLVRNAGKLVEKEELLKSVWADAFVEENNLNKSIHAIRRALGESEDLKFIETVKKYGFRFTADVELLNGAPAVADREPATSPGVVREFPHLVTRGDAQSGNAVLAVAAAPDLNEPSEEASVLPKNVLRAVPKTAAAGVVRGRLYPAIIAVALVAVLTGGAFVYRYGAPAEAGAATKLAVLPLKPVVEESRNTAIEFAVAESLILKFGESKNFDVKRLNTVRKFVDPSTDAVEAGRELNVDYVLASNYQIENGRIRVTSQLIRVDSGSVELTSKSEADAASVFGMQDAVANDVGNAVFAKFGRPKGIYASRRGTENEEAYNLYQQAWYLIDKGTAAESAKAAELLDKAVELDPNYAQAWAVRSYAYCQFAHLGGGEPITIYKKAQPMLERALELDPQNAMAYAIRGTINRDHHWNSAQAIVDLEKSIELDPGIVLTHRILAGVYYRDGKFEQAIEAQRRAVDLHPTSLWDHWFLGTYLAGAGRREEGLAQLDRVLEMGAKTQPFVYNTLWRIYSAHGDEAKAFENFMKARRMNNLGDDVLRGYEDSYKSGGWKAVMRTELNRITSADRPGTYSPTKVYVAQVASQIGERDTAFRYLEEALKYRSIEFSFLKVDPMLADLRKDDRFADLVRRSGI